jgi:hypothetical protein
LLVFATYMVAQAIKAAMNARKLNKAEWEVVLEEASDSTEFWLVKGGNADFIGRALRKSDDYALKFSDLEAEAEEMKMERNAAIRVLERRK